MRREAGLELDESGILNNFLNCLIRSTGKANKK